KAKEVPGGEGDGLQIHRALGEHLSAGDSGGRSRSRGAGRTGIFYIAAVHPQEPATDVIVIILRLQRRVSVRRGTAPCLAYFLTFHLSQGIIAYLTDGGIDGHYTTINTAVALLHFCSDQPAQVIIGHFGDDNSG